MSLILLLAPAAFAAGALLVYVAPERVRERSVRWRQGLAVLGAAAAVMATGAATGIALWDGALRALVAAGVVLLAARARPKPALLSAMLVAVAGIGGTWSLALGGAAAGVALATALTVRRQGPLLTSLVGLLVGQAALRLPFDQFHGASTLAAIVALAPLVVSGYRNLRSAHQRRVRRALLGLVAVTVVVTGLTGVGVLLVRRSLQAGIDESRAGLSASREAQTDEASRRFSAAANAFTDGRDGLERIWVTPGRLVPLLGQNLRLLHAAARSGAELSIAASESAGVAQAESIRVEGGRLDLARVRSLEHPLEASTSAVRFALRELDAADSGWIIGPLRDRFARQHDDLVDAEDEAETALLAVRVLPGLLGGSAPRRYFLAVQQPAEARGSGGIVGNYGEVTAVNGDLDVGKFGRDGELNEAAAAHRATLEGAPLEYVARYGRFTPERIWQNVTMSPHFPNVAQTIRVLYPQSGGQPVDGVIAVTPRALAALLRVTGPIEVPPWPEPITADNAEQVLQVDQYVKLPDSARVDFLGDVAETVTRRLTSGTLPPPAELARFLSPVVRSGDLRLHSFVAEEQRLFDRLGAGGELEAHHGDDVVALVTQNAGGNKLDAYLQRTMAYRATAGAATVKVTLRNDGPTSGVPSVVNGSFVGDPPGTNRVYVSIHSSRTLVAASISGASLAMESEREEGLQVYSAYVVVPPSQERVLVVRLGSRSGRDVRRRTVVRHQPTVIPDRVELREAGGAHVFEGPLTEDRIIVGR